MNGLLGWGFNYGPHDDVDWERIARERRAAKTAETTEATIGTQPAAEAPAPARRPYIDDDGPSYTSFGCGDPYCSFGC